MFPSIIRPSGTTKSLPTLVLRLQKQLENGQAKLDFAPDRGYLTTLLRQLDIDIDSQVLVFSKSSIQTAAISTLTARAIYFNYHVAVGYVRGGGRAGTIVPRSEPGYQSITVST